MPFYGYSVVDTTPKPVGRKPSLPLPTAKSGSSGQYQPRGFPERISANDVAGHDPLMEGIGAAARAPGYIYERPFAAVNTAARAITGTKPGEKSFIDQASDTIMGTPVLGDVLRTGGNVIDASSKLAPSLVNSQLANNLKDTAAFSDSHPLDDFQRFLYGGDLNTVGDLRRYAAKRNFMREDIDALSSGTKGVFDFADKPMDQNRLIDLAGRLTLDPINALAIAGPARILGAAGKIGKIGDLERSTAQIMKLADARAAVKGIPALSRPAKGVAEGVAALRAGIGEGVTHRSAALFLMGMGRGGSALLGSYRKLAIGTTMGQLGVNALDTVIGDNSAVPGPLNDLFLLGRAMRDDTPLSDGMLFSLWAVTHFPARDMIGTVIKGANGRIRYHNPKSADVEARFVNEFGEGKTYAARRADFMARMGGEESWLDYHADLQAKHAAEGFAKSFTDQPNPRTMVETEMYHDLMNRQARARAAHDPIGGIEAMETARDWAMGGRFSSGLIAEAVAGLKMAFRPELMFSQWSAFRAIASRISAIPGFGSGSAVVPNLRQFLIREQLQAAHAELNMIAKANKGMIPAADAARFVNDHPALVINPETQQFWARALTPDAEALPVGSYTQRLRAAERDAVSMKEAVAPAESWEAMARKEAANRAGAIRKDGSVDISKLDTEGQVVIMAPSATGIGKRNAGFAADSLDDVREMRNDPRLAALEGEETHRVMEAAGYDIGKGRQVIAGEDGALAPGILYAAGTHVGQAEEALAALMKRAGGKSAGRIIVPGHLAEAAGKVPNALQHEWVIGGMSDMQARRVTDLFNNLFDGPIFDDTVGIMKVVTEKGTAGVAGKLAIAARLLGDMFPERALGGVFDPQTTRVWTETIRDTGRSRRGRAARAAGTERSVADIAAGAQRSVNWHTANNEFAALGPLPDRRGAVGVAGQPRPNAGPAGQPPVTGGGDPTAAGAGPRVGTGTKEQRIAQRNAVWDEAEAELRTYESLSGGRLRVRRTGNGALGVDVLDEAGEVIISKGTSESVPREGQAMSSPQEIVSSLIDDKSMWHAVKSGPDSTTAELVAMREPGFAVLRELLDAKDAATPIAAGAGSGVGSDVMPLSVLEGMTEISHLGNNRGGIGLQSPEQSAALRESLARDGFTSPVLLRYNPLRRTVSVADGHHRLIVAKELGITDIPVKIEVVSDAVAKVVRPNELAVKGHVGEIAPTPFGEPVRTVTAADIGLGSQPTTSGLTGELKYLRDPLDQLVPKYDASLNERFTPEELAKFAPLQEEITRYDPTYSMSSGPKGATPFYLGQGKAYADMAIGKQMTGDMLKYKVTSKVANFNHVLFGRVYTKRLASDGKQEFASDLINAGETPRMVSSFLAALKTEAETSRLVGEHAQLWMRGDLLPTGVINLIARGEKPGLFPGFKAETFEKLGGPTGVSEALRRSASRFYRKLEQNHRAVDGAGSLGKLIDLTYGPATGRINGLTGRTTHAIKGLYPVLRFKLDPRWHLMNKYEAPIIGAVRFGVRREKQHSTLDTRAFDTMGSSEGFQSMDAMASGWLDQRPLDDFMIPAFRVERTDSTIRVIESLGENHPLMIRVRERHGDGQTSRQYADALDKDLYDFDTKGVRKTVEDEARQILDDDYYTAMQPLLQRITDLHRENFRTVVHSFHGNVNRSNVERMMNSWFLYWPISYQLKVAKVLFDTLTYRMGGRQTDLLGAWTIDRLQDEHTKRLATDREYQRMFESNPEVWQFAAQFLPVTPYDLGVSANRATRYISSAAGAALGFWDKDKAYPDLSGPKGWITMGERVANLGLPYSIDQAVRTLNAVLEKD